MVDALVLLASVHLCCGEYPAKGDDVWVVVGVGDVHLSLACSE